ncbi:MAG: hypothetical protein IJ306_06280 [Oscillospiraceae bacterium]|nr:hypothetical protein [Oscillospiraceae bacterium]
MKNEKLFDAITEIDEKYIDEANTEKIHVKKGLSWKVWGTVAACLVVAAAVGTVIRFFPPGASAGGGTNREPGSNYMSYAGPAFPLATLEDVSGIIFERSTDFDFSPYYPYEDSYEDSDGETVTYEVYDDDVWVTDSYIAKNTTDEDITFTAVYPFAGSIRTETDRIPSVTIDGSAAETELKIGPYSGGFSPAWGDESGESISLNLSSIESWDEYKALLENGEYLKAAFAEKPTLDQSVIVYSFDIEYNIDMEEFDKIDNPDALVTFDCDYEKSGVMFIGFNGMTWSREEGWAKVTSSVPKSFNPDFEKNIMHIIVYGDDIDNINMKSTAGEIEHYNDERAETDAFTVTMERREMTLGEIILETISSENYGVIYYGNDYEHTVRDMLSDEEYLGFVAEFMYAHGQLSENPAQRYDGGRLDDVISETASVSRIMYVTFEVTVPAGESVVIETKTLREASYDFYGGREKLNIEGFDLVTRAGTNLVFEKQSASVSNTEYIEIVYNNFGFDIENGIMNVLLGEEEHYWMEIISKKQEE